MRRLPSAVLPSRRGRAVATAALAAMMMMTVPRPAFATDPATAQALFDQGRKLMAQERWAEACPKLEESQRLDPAGGTLLHLALCREHEGKTATASALYQDALAQAKRDARKDRARLAQERIEALASRVPRMRIRVAVANRRAEGFTLSRDELVVGEAQWGESLPVDPGAHLLAARANGRKPWTVRVDVPARAHEVVVDVPDLALEPVDSPRSGDASRPSTASSPSSPSSPSRPSRLEGAQVGDAQRTAGIVALGAGVAGVLVGSVFGLISISKNADADKECTPPDRRLCSAKGIEAGDAATSAGNVSTIAFLAGGVFLAGGLALYFTAPTGGTVALVPAASPRGASLGLSARF